MSDLGPDSRALIDAASADDDPSTGDDLRMRRALTRRLGAGVGLVVTATTGAATAGTATAATVGAAGAAGTAGATGAAIASGGLLAKTLAAVALVGAVSAGGVALREPREHAAPSVRVVETSSPRSSPPVPSPAMPATVAAPIADPVTPTDLAPPSATLPSATPAPATPSTAIPPATHPPPSSSSRGATSTIAAAAPSAVVIAMPSPAVAVSAVAPSAAAVDLDEESRLLREADQALRAHDGATALARLDEHARRFPQGVLAEERAGQRVLALCESRRVDDARAEAAAFLAKSPRSPLAPWVRRSCGGP